MPRTQLITWYNWTRFVEGRSSNWVLIWPKGKEVVSFWKNFGNNFLIFLVNNLFFLHFLFIHIFSLFLGSMKCPVQTKVLISHLEYWHIITEHKIYSLWKKWKQFDFAVKQRLTPHFKHFILITWIFTYPFFAIFHKDWPVI